MIPLKRISGYLYAETLQNQNLSSSGMEFHPEANQVEYVICPARIDDKVADKARIALGVSEVQPRITVKCFKLMTMKY
jgi:hypothetical protein